VLVENRKNMEQQTPEGPCQSLLSKGCSEIGRPLRTPSNAVETQEATTKGLKKLGFEKSNGKVY